MERHASLLVVCTLLVSSIAVGGFATAQSQQTYLVVEDVTVTPNPPEPDGEFSVVAAVTNRKNSSERYQIGRVELRGGSDANFTLHDDVSVPGILRSGDKRYVRLTGSIDESGRHTLRIHVYGETESGEPIHVQHTTEIRVGAERPQLAFEADDGIAGTDSRMNVTVANGLPTDVRNVRLSVEGQNATVENPRRVRSGLASGEESTFEFTVRADSPGVHRFDATLRYVTANGTTRTVTQDAFFRVEPLSDRVSLNARSVSGGSAVAVTVTNYGNVPLQDVVVRGDSPNATLTDAPMDDLAPGESRTVELNITRFDADGAIPVEAVATYEVGGERGRTNGTVELASNPGAIRLTGIELERESGTLHLSGSASNIGLTEANSVIVSVVPTEGVEPAQPNKEYFVGTVPASDFVSFEVYADASENVSQIPLKVTYLVDGERRTYTVNVDYDSEGEDVRASVAGGSDDLLVPAAVAGVVAVGVLGIMLLAWRNSRDGA